MMERGKVLLVITDGVGYRENSAGNAVKLSGMRNFNRILDECPNRLLNASGAAVGLPDGQMGNSEVGHMTIGSGRIILQDLYRIDKAITEGDFFKNSVLVDAVNYAKKKNSALHIMGLLSDGGVHSSNIHLYAIMELAKSKGIKKLFIHPFMDGRDTPPKSGVNYLSELLDKIKQIGIGKIAGIHGRYYAMDRDKRWDRIKLTYDALVSGKGILSSDPISAIKKSYADGITDEFVIPTIITENGKPVKLIEDNDSVIFMNFRGDRARQLTRAFVSDGFSEFPREKKPVVKFSCMAEYDSNLDLPVAFLPPDINNSISEVISKNGLRQLHIAETEKYAHVTFFFSGGREDPFPGEDRIIIPSPKVATYDLSPQMSADKITQDVVDAMKSGKYAFIVVNFANGDMVGHTAILSAAISAMKTIDNSINKLNDTAGATDFTMIITADHGNVEEEIDENGNPMTAHTTNPVYFAICGKSNRIIHLKKGDFGLSSIAAAILDLMGIEKPNEMAESLIE